MMPRALAAGLCMGALLHGGLLGAGGGERDLNRISAAQMAPDIPAALYLDLEGNPKDPAGLAEVGGVKADMVVFLPLAERSIGTALVVFPGGGYRSGHDMGHHVEDNARYFVPRGIAIIGVRYRVAAPGAEPTRAVVASALADARQAIRLVRSRAGAWHLDSRRIGVLGYSAGGHLALNLAGHFDGGDPTSDVPILRQSSRPDFIAALCPWPWKDDVADFHFGADCPPMFLGSAEDDPIAPTSFAVGIAASLAKAAVPVELDLYPSGGHMAFHFDQATEASKWPERFLPWLRSLPRPDETAP
jgi:acetyl esterase/lipase